MPDGLTNDPIHMLDLLLADIAVRIQLSPSQHRLAVNRYHTIADLLEEQWKDRPYELRVRPQGSMRIGATIAVRDDDGHDIDLTLCMTEKRPLVRPPSPAEILDDLYRTLDGHGTHKGKIDRKTRCCTVDYEDMHLDVTPWQPRQMFSNLGWVMHHRAEERARDPRGTLVPSSPESFACWFQEQLPDDRAFRQFMLEQTLELERRRSGLVIKAADPVPDDIEPYKKPRALICLQLIKRFRNLRHQKRDGRIPPSILLTYLVGEIAPYSNPETGLLDELLRISKHIYDRLDRAVDEGGQIDIANPRDAHEKLTDRWPATYRDLATFRNDMADFQQRLYTLRRSNMVGMQEVLQGLFGETVGAAAIRKLSEDRGAAIQAGQQHLQRRGSGGLLSAPTILGGGAAHASGVVAPRSQFYGEYMRRAVKLG